MARVKRIVLAFVICGCGSGDKPADKPAAAPPAPPPPVAAPAPAPPKAAVPPPPAKLPACSDGGAALFDAAITSDGARFCLGAKQPESCWTFDAATGAIKPLAAGTATEPGAVPVPDEPPPPKPMWSAKVDGDAISVCGPAGCKPFAVTPGKPDDDAAAIQAAAVSPSGMHVVVMRGLEALAQVTVEVYDRASGKRLGVARPRSMCTELEGFAGEVAVLQDWDCANKGGERELVAPTGKVLARLAQFYTPSDAFAQIDDRHWVFSSREAFDIYDVTNGKHIAGHPIEEDARIATAHGRMYAFERAKARVSVFAPDGKQLASGRVPPCRFEWETLALGPVHLHMTAAEAMKAVGEPAKRTPQDPNNFFASTWTYANGLALRIQAANLDPNSTTPRAIPPFSVVGMAITAPSKLRLGDIGIGSTREQVEAAFGAHAIAAHTSKLQLFAGNADESEGIVFAFKDDKLAQIVIGSGSDPSAPDD